MVLWGVITSFSSVEFAPSIASTGILVVAGFGKLAAKGVAVTKLFGVPAYRIAAATATAAAAAAGSIASGVGGAIGRLLPELPDLGLRTAGLAVAIVAAFDSASHHQSQHTI